MPLASCLLCSLRVAGGEAPSPLGSVLLGSPVGFDSWEAVKVLAVSNNSLWGK